MKKFITITALVILLFNFISVRSYAAVDANGLFDTTKALDLIPQEIGKVTLVTDEGQEVSSRFDGKTFVIGLAFKSIVKTLTVIPQAFNMVLDFFVQVTTEDRADHYTIYDTVMGHYDLFNIDYLNIPTQLTDESTLMEEIKFYVIKSYRAIRNFSIAISLFVLIYIGIRMAISTVASEKARYKNMFIYWVTSLVLVFLIHLIVIIISVVLQVGLDIVENIAKAWKVSNLEDQMFSGSRMYISTLKSGMGVSVFSTALTIWIIAYYQIKFFIYYLRRTLEVNFLIIVSPLVTITYSIDKSGDNRAQAFGQFMKMLIAKSTIQLLHAAVYVVFIATAGVIAVRHPLLAALFFAALSRTEKIATRIFQVDEAGFQKVKIPFISGK
jgi:hypothetical protein